MLNPTLYKALEKLFPRIEIANEGVHSSIVVNPTGDGSWTSNKESDGGEEYRVDCPFCKDHKGHLYISYLSYASPVIDGMPLRVCKLLAHCFRRDCLSNPDNRMVLEQRIGAAMASIGPVTPLVDMTASQQCPEDPHFKVSDELTLDGLRTWVPDWQPLEGDIDRGVLEYLESRRITKADIEWLQIGWGPIKSPTSGNYLNDGLPWVLFPIMKNHKLAGVQARCPDCYLKDDGIKYYFHPACRKKTVVFNLDYAREIGTGVLCEGVFDVASIGRPGVCTFGHTPSIAQCRMLTSSLECLIWLPDTDVKPTLDAIAIANKQVTAWNAAGVFPKGAHVVILPAKDAGEMTRQQIWEAIITQVPQELQQHLMARVVQKV